MYLTLLEACAWVDKPVLKEIDQSFLEYIFMYHKRKHTREKKNLDIAHHHGPCDWRQLGIAVSLKLYVHVLDLFVLHGLHKYLLINGQD